ncbi:MAG: type II secretion system protein GspD [Planctomycetota bacterium]
MSNRCQCFAPLVIAASLCLSAVFAPAMLRAQALPNKLTFVELHHVSAQDVLQFLRDAPDFLPFITSGAVRAMPSKQKSLVVTANPETTTALIQTIREYEHLEIRDRVRMEPVRVNYANVSMILESLAAAGICQVWHRSEEVQTHQEKQGNNTITHTYKQNVYQPYDAAKGTVALSTSRPPIPYVIEIPHVDPIEIPPVNMGTGHAQSSFSLDFPQSPSTEERNRVLVVGTDQDIEAIKSYVAQLDQPARQIMIEVQIVELNANSLSDLGIDIIAGQQRYNTVDFTTPGPGEPIPQPSDPFNAITQAGLSFLFDDAQEKQSGKFLAGVHALIRNGEAMIKARPKLYTLDDRQNVLHIGSEVPTFQSTSVNRDIAGGNFVENVNQVTKQYIGITVNVRPRVSGPEANEVSMLVDIQINNLTGRDRVFEEDLLGVPTIAVRQFRGQARIKNHRPLILGGLIQEEDDTSNYKVPLLGDIPWVGDWLGRRNKRRVRTEIILVLTPHILSERVVDPISTPKESLHFDTFNSVLFNDRYLLKGRDLVGIDPISKAPAESYTPEQALDLTLLNIVKRRELVRKLRILDEYIGEAALTLGLFKRSYPEKSVRYWPTEERKLYYQAAAIVVENIKSLNPDLNYDEIVRPRREIVLPTSPYHVSLSFDKLKTFYEKGGEVLMRSGGAQLSDNTIKLLSELSGHDLREFADFVDTAARKREDHGVFVEELERYATGLFPELAGAPAATTYGDALRAWSTKGISFVGIATHLKNRLDGQFSTQPPRLGRLEEDLLRFASRSVSLVELGQRLMDLDNRWEQINSSAVTRPVQGL